MSNFASGKYSWYICDRTGHRYRLKDMRFEWNGLLVGKDVWEPKHPQINPQRNRTADKQAIENARPDRVEPLEIHVGVPLYNAPDKRGFVAYGKIGSVTVTTS